MRSWAILLIAMAIGASCASISTAEREQIKREVLEEVRAETAEDPTATPVRAELAAGAVEGRVLRAGEPLPGCRVRLVQVEVRRGAFGNSTVPIAQFESETDRDGTYRFESVPVGAYKIKWAPPGADHWIRMLSPDPDLAVEVGRTTQFRDIESARRALGQ